MYDSHAEDYLNEVMDRYGSKPETVFTEPAAVKALASLFFSHLLLSSVSYLFLFLLKDMINRPLKDTPMQLEWANDYELERYTYLSRLLPLRKQQSELEIQDELLRRQREQMFPQSKEEFNTKANGVKMRVARFLIADAARQEMLDDFNWVGRQVKPLQTVFVKDVRNIFLCA